MNDYNEALWRWFLNRAAVHNGYGWNRLVPSVRKHLLDCGIDHEFSDLPEVGNVSEFDGTDNSNVEVEAITVRQWRCRCHQWSTEYGQSNWYYGDTLAIEGNRNLGEIIYGVVQEGLRDQEAPLSSEKLEKSRRALALERLDSHVSSRFVKCAICHDYFQVKGCRDWEKHPWEAAQELGWTLAYQGPEYSPLETDLQCPKHKD